MDSSKILIRPYIRKVQFYETDQMGIVHHSNYIRWFEEARVDFMEQMGYGYDRATESGVDVAVLEANCKYISMVRFGESVEIAARISKLTQTRMTVEYEIRDSESSVLRSSGYTNHCYISRAKGSPIALGRELPELYSLFERCVQSC